MVMDVRQAMEDVQVQEGTATVTYTGDDLWSVLNMVVMDNRTTGLEWANLQIDKRQRNRETGKHPWVMQVMK